MPGENRLLALAGAQPPDDGGWATHNEPLDYYQPKPSGIGSDWATARRAERDYYGPIMQLLAANEESRKAGERAAALPQSYAPGDRETADFIDKRNGQIDLFQGAHWRHLWKMGGKERQPMPDVPFDPRLPLGRPE